ncbi:MAG TPA: flagellar basal body-associated protein FliL [Xanthobacteraceae bacterium]|nr:flagellar basal body-associated protein FliL [Xanthobacteraceae bacterium]
MADNDQTEDGALDGGVSGQSIKKSKSKLWLMVGALVLALAGGAGGYYFFFAPGGGAEHAKAKPVPPPLFVDVPEMLVNLSVAPGERVQYLKVRAVLEVKDQPQVVQVTPVLPRVVDLFQTYLRELRPTDLHGSMGLFRLKEELTRRVNAAVSPGQVNAVLFKEVVIQ